MKQWAAKVEQLTIRCPECQRIAQRILRDEPLRYGEWPLDMKAVLAWLRGGQRRDSTRS